MRQLPDNLEQALFDGRRRPAFQLLAFDPQLDSLGAVVTGTYTQEPLDLTPYIKDAISWKPDQLDFTLGEEYLEIFHPDTGALRAYLADTAILRLREGDSRVPKADWVNTFTGQIKGQVGWQKNRASGVLEAKISAFSRENTAALKRRQITTREYSVGTELGVFVSDLVQTFFGLSPAEIRLPAVLGLQLQHQVNQISQMSPWDAVSALLQTVAKVPCFDGDGRFTCYDKNMHRLPDRVLPDYKRVLDYQIPARTQDYINKVRVTFLDSDLTRVDAPYQKLGQAQVTTGFFSRAEKLPCWWSEDHSQRADGTTMQVIKSVNSGLLPVGSESYRQVDEFHGVIEVEVSVWIPILATVMLLEYLAAAFIPDKLPGGQPVQVGISGTGITLPMGITLSWGKLVQAQALIGILLIMMSLGSAQYEVWGTPYDYAYLEEESTAIEDGLEYWEENEKQIKNDFLGSYEQADALALTELIWEKSQAYPRTLVMADDLALERGDILALPDGRKFCIIDLSKTIKPGEADALTLNCIKVMTP